jgi:hypothetical protein
VRGLDLAQLWRRRRWRFLLNIIDRLPRDSHFVEAQAADEQFAEAVLAMPPASVPTTPRWSEWTPERQALADIVDRLGDVVTAVLRAGGAKHVPSIPRYPRPVTAADRLRDKRRIEQHYRIVAMVLPDRTQEGGVTDGRI